MSVDSVGATEEADGLLKPLWIRICSHAKVQFGLDMIYITVLWGSCKVCPSTHSIAKRRGIRNKKSWLLQGVGQSDL